MKQCASVSLEGENSKIHIEIKLKNSCISDIMDHIKIALKPYADQDVKLIGIYFYNEEVV